MSNTTYRQETAPSNKVRIAKFILEKGSAAKAEIALGLGLSMPTTLQNVKELEREGIIREAGEYESTGGRKAKALSVVGELGYSVGMDITKSAVSFALVNMKKELIQKKQISLAFEDSRAYQQQAADEAAAFILESGVPKDRILGVGVSLPGIVDRERKLLIQSQVLGVNNMSFQPFECMIQYPCEIDNDANSAASSELPYSGDVAIYLSLSDTVGGAICVKDRLYPGKNFKSGEFGHMVIEKHGRRCYCGKQGCADAYCSTRILRREAGGSLETFFQRLKSGDARCLPVWEEYLENLAVVVQNLRIIFDCDVVLGGYLGGYLEEYLETLGKKVLRDNHFEQDASFIHTGKYKQEAAAYGACLPFIYRYLDAI